jgi:hypothetical protein
MELYSSLALVRLPSVALLLVSTLYLEPVSREVSSDGPAKTETLLGK